MKIRIGKFDAATGMVSASFTEDANRHVRPVRAVITDGVYDPEATRARAEEVGLGVTAKWAMGLLGPDPAPPE